MDLLSFFLAVAFMIVTIGGIIVAGVIVIKSNNSNFINRDEANSKQKAQIIAKMKQGNFCKYESNVAKLHFLFAAHGALVVPLGALVSALRVACCTQLLELRCYRFRDFEVVIAHLNELI